MGEVFEAFWEGDDGSRFGEITQRVDVDACKIVLSGQIELEERLQSMN